MDDATALLELLNKSFYEATSGNAELAEYLSERLRPAGGFTPDQTTLLAQVKLQISDIDEANYQLNNINFEAYPFSFGFAPMLATDGFYYLNADLLTDCLRPGDHYEWAKGYLINLKIVSAEGIEWAPPPDEE
jgi:hypothetical protein